MEDNDTIDVEPERMCTFRGPFLVSSLLFAYFPPAEVAGAGRLLLQST